MAIAKYYPVDADHSVVYWTESYSMSDTDFARKVSDMIGKRITASSLSHVDSSREMDKLERGAGSMVHVS